MTEVAIVGIGIQPFGRHPDKLGVDHGVTAVRAALKDAGAEWNDIQFAFGGTRSGGNNTDPVLPRLGLTGIQLTNVANGCATGGASMASAYNAIVSGQYDMGVALGFEKYPRGALAALPESWALPGWIGTAGLMPTTQYFAMKAKRYMHEFGISPETFALVAEKAFANGSINPIAWRREALTAEQIANSPMVSDPLTKYMFCNPSDGGAAMILCRADIAHRFSSKPVFLRAAAVRSRLYGSFDVFGPSAVTPLPEAPSTLSSRAAYEMAGVGPEDLDFAQLQDTEAGAEVIHMAEVGLCKNGEQEAMIKAGETRLGGRIPVNTDGGCMANGEPVAASGLRQIYETVLQLRGAAGPRQVEGAKVALTQVYGAPGISGCTILTA